MGVFPKWAKILCRKSQSSYSYFTLQEHLAVCSWIQNKFYPKCFVSDFFLNSLYIKIGRTVLSKITHGPVRIVLGIFRNIFECVEWTVFTFYLSYMLFQMFTAFCVSALVSYSNYVSSCRAGCEMWGMSEVFPGWFNYFLHKNSDGWGSQRLEVWDTCKFL